MKSKGFNKAIVSVISIIILLLIGYKIYNVNKDIPRKYKLDEYLLNKEIKLDNLTLKALSVNKENAEYDDDYKEIMAKIHLKFNVTINSNNDEDILTLVRSSLIQDKRIPDILEKSENLKSLKFGESKTVDLVWTVPPSYLKNLKYLDVYLPKSLYSKQIKESYNKGLLYAKYIRIPLT